MAMRHAGIIKTMKIKKIELGTEKVSEEEYNKIRLNFIADYSEYQKGYSTGFFGGWKDGYYKKFPDVGEADWNSQYPNGYKDWLNSMHIPAEFAIEVRDKLNEIIDVLNKKK